MTARRWLWMAVAAAALAGCKTEVVCPANQTACGESCLALQIDAKNCGACGRACGAGEVCSRGSCSLCAATCTSTRGCANEVCLPDLEVACFASGEVQALAADLTPVGPARKVDGGPISLAPLGGRTWAAHSYPSPTVRSVDPAGAVSPSVLLGGGDLEMIRVHAGAYGRADGLLYLSDATPSTLVVVDPVAALAGSAGAVVDEVDLHRLAANGENPKGIAFAGGKAYVALYGDAFVGDYAHGQAIAVVSLPASACAAPPCATKTVLSLSGVPGAADAPGLPFPSGAVAVGTKVYVTLANLKQAFGFYGTPAGPGKLLVIDSAAADALSVVQLPGCDNPGSIVAAGTKLWVACGGTSAVLAVDVSGAAPVPAAAAVPSTVVSGGIAICNGMGYVTDQWSGDVVRFDPAGVLPTVKAAGVCPVYPPTTGFAWAADVTCAP